MTITSVIVCFGGIWVNDTYEGGDKKLIIFPSDGISFDLFLDKIRTAIGGVDRKFLTYSITCLIVSPVDEYSSVRLDITNDLELQYSLDNGVCKFFVDVSPMLSCLPKEQPNCVNLQNPQESACRGEKERKCRNMPKRTRMDADLHRGHRYSDDMSSEDFDDDEFQDEDAVSVDSLCSADDHTHVTSPVRNMHLTPHLPDSSPPHTFLDDETSLFNRETSRQWVVPGALYQASLFVNETSNSQEYSRDSLSLGATFDNKDKVITAVGVYHLVNKVEYYVQRSSQTHYYVICKHNNRGCEFQMRSVSECDGSFWRVTHWKAPHTCQMDLRVQCRRTLCSKVIGAYFATKLKNISRILKPNDMISELRSEFGFQIKYPLALAGRNRAIDLIYGDPDESFQQIPSYLHMVRHCNPGSSVAIKTDHENVFEYAFMALGASITGFRSSCRPVIVVDGTHLKGKYKGILFVAASQDGNEQVYPLAFGLGDKENDKSWTWFFSQLKATFGCPQDLIFISDQHISISKAVQTVYPGIPHGLCAVHMQKNLTQLGKGVVGIFKKAAYCHRKDLLDKYMKDLEASKSSAFIKLSELDPRTWSRSYCPVRRYNFMTSNCAESVNNCLRWARRLPVCTLLECIRTMIGLWFVERRDKAHARNHELTKNVSDALNLSIQEGQTFEVEAINSSKFSVKQGFRVFIVDLAINSCSCREFDINLIPCSHAAASICKANQSPISYVSSYYKMDTLREIYRGDINPIPPKDEWIIPENVKSIVVRVPVNPTQAGRPRKKRIPSFVESSRRSRARVCTRCKQKGHYRSTCNVELSIHTADQVEVQPLCARCERSCSVCHQKGHTKKKCTLNVNHSG